MESKNILYYKNEAVNFETALPIGNGSFGAMVYGGVSEDKISLNHDTLWSGKPNRTVIPEAYEVYKKAKELVKNDRVDTAEDLISGQFTADWTQNYLPLGNLHVKSKRHNADTYSRMLDMGNAIVNVDFECNNSKSIREYFASNPDDVIISRYQDDEPQDYMLSVNSQLKYSLRFAEDRIIIKGECPSNLFPGDRPAEVPCTYDGDGIKFTTIIKVVTDGTVSLGGCGLHIENSTDMCIYTATVTSYIDYNTMPTAETDKSCEEKIENAAAKNYKELRDRHINDYTALYNRTDIDLFSNNTLPTDELLNSHSNYAAMAELMFNYAKYLMICASRPGTQAMNLQGIWNEEWQPPWCSSYTLNINTEMNYWPALSMDLAELQKPLEDLASKLSDTGATTAKEYYDAPGYVSHHVTDLWGMSTACGPKTKKNCSWGFWNMSSAWLLNELFSTYEYTKDIEWLKQSLYPMIKGLTEFYMYMLDDVDGKKVMMMSTSPENRYLLDGTSEALAKYTTMTQELLILLFSNCIKCCEILDTDSDLKDNLEKIIPYLDTFEVGSNAQLLEWDREYEDVDVHHRHVSHLYGVYPGMLFTEKSNRKLYDASRKSLEIRGDDGTGWSIAWKINLWARFKDGNHSFEVFKKQMEPAEIKPVAKVKNGLKLVETVGVRGGTYPNLFDAHPPFQIDGNFGAAMGIIQWFIQCEDGVIKILPALPDELANGKVSGFMAKGNIKTFIEWKNGRCTGLCAVSPIGQTAVFEVNGERIAVELKKDEKIKLI